MVVVKLAANALYFLYHNFARIHRTLRMTPAMAAGISEHVWSIEEIVGLLETWLNAEAAMISYSLRPIIF